MDTKQLILIVTTVVGSVVGGETIDINGPKRAAENKQLLLDQNIVLDKMLKNQEALIEKGCAAHVTDRK